MALFSRVTVWVSNQVLTAAALNGEFNNILNNAQISSWVGYSTTVTQMQTLFNPGGIGTENQPVSGADEVASLRYMIKFLSGGTQWYDSTGRSLAAGQLAVQTADITALAITPPLLSLPNYVTSGTSGTYQVVSTSFVVPTPTASTTTISIATPALITPTSGGAWSLYDPVVFTNSGGALPTGITSGTTYYVLNPTGTTFNVSATPGGTAINTSGSQSGTQTVTYAGLITPNITTIGRPVEICLIPDGISSVNNITVTSGPGATSVSFYIEVLRGSTVIYSTPIIVGSTGTGQTAPTGLTSGTTYYVGSGSTTSTNTSAVFTTTSSFSISANFVTPCSVIKLTDFVAAGTYSYSLKVHLNNSGDTAFVKGCKLYVREI